MLGEVIEDVAAFVNLAALDDGAPAEHVTIATRSHKLALRQFNTLHRGLEKDPRSGSVAHWGLRRVDKQRSLSTTSPIGNLSLAV